MHGGLLEGVTAKDSVPSGPAMLMHLSAFLAQEPLFRCCTCGHLLGASTKTSFGDTTTEALAPTLPQCLPTPVPSLLLMPSLWAHRKAGAFCLGLLGNGDNSPVI